MQNKHILILTPGFPKDESDNNCIPPLQEFLKGFINSYPHTKFTVISLHYPYKTEKYFWNGITVIPFSGKDNKIKKPFLWYKIISEAKKLNNETKFDMIHSFWFGECAMLGNILSNKFNCEHICTLMGQDVKSSNKYLRLLRSREIKIIAIAKNQSEQFYKLTNRKADKIIHWGINDLQLNFAERDIDLLGVGSLIPLKNYPLLIKTVEEIIKLNSYIKCVIVGEGPEEAKLKSLVIAKGLGNNIGFTGLLNRKEVYKLMQRVKIFVHPSQFEGFGYVFAEALANGMNIVSFNVGCAMEHPKWFIAKDEEDFIAITKELISDKRDFTPVNPFPLVETVNQYAFIYGIS